MYKGERDIHIERERERDGFQVRAVRDDFSVDVDSQKKCK